MHKWLKPLAGEIWAGNGELWLDPAGNTAERYACKLQIEQNTLRYFWNYQNKEQCGILAFYPEKITWSDSWHQQETVTCTPIPAPWGLLTIRYEYGEPDQPRWGWRIQLSQRPDRELVLQMTNIAPWGEENRAVRMVFHPQN